ncbi:MAG TPA: TlpA disulfide reductase family protein [Phycisphaerae bacterium]|nr:TlpA disulfide reductase family protein [Phycisphaerae bacterium]
MSQGCALTQRRSSFVYTSICKCSFVRFVAPLALMGGLACSSSETTRAPVQASNDSIYRYSAYRYQYPPTPPILDGASLRRFVDQYEHQVVILEFWATWSPTSRAELAPLAQLQEETYAEGLRVVACTFDSPGEWASRVVPMLQSARANFPCMVIPKEARAEVREWLGTDWSYDVPARFVIDQNGRVTMRAFSSDSIDGVIAEARSLVSSGGGEFTALPPPHEIAADPDQDHPAALRSLRDDREEAVESSAAGDRFGHEIRASARTPVRPAAARQHAGTVTLRARLVNVASGEAESLPLIYSSSGDSALMAGELAAVLSDRLNRANNDRIAIVPFAPTTRRTRPTPFGRELAAGLEASMRTRGYYDLLGPAAAERALVDAETSALAIDYDPTLAQRRVAADFLVIGWLQGETQASPPRQSFAADDALENPGAD